MPHEIQDKELSDEEYDENADEDFNPEAGPGEASSSDDEEAEAAVVKKPAKGSKKRKAAGGSDDLDSGDEATMQERSRKRKKATAEDEDSGGEGGLIKTRAQRLAEKIERKQRKRGVQGEVTVDVDALWAHLKHASVGRESHVPPKAADGDDEEDKENAEARRVEGGDELITVKRRIEYAGEITEVEERIPRSSREAQRYLRQHPEADPSHPNHTPAPDTETDARSINRPLRRASLFEPNPSAIIKGVPPEKLRPRAPNRLDVLMAEKRLEEERKKKAEKMSTVQKSALDWRGWVDKQEGLREELDVYGRSKQGFLAREDFLGRADYAREVQAREARLKG